MALATETISSASSSPASSSCGGLERRGAGDLDLAVEMRGAVLKRLELADQLAELLALLEIIDGHRRCAGGDADQLGRGAGAAGVERRD